jgi:AcrR family transcriptional regulator/DNA-binding MarR family transcriptional regulator
VLTRSAAPATGAPRAQIAEIQRSRLLAGAIRSVEELGYAETSVAQITSRARVSRRTFYELFANREECLSAVLEDVVALVEGELRAAGLERLAWRERMRSGLWAILSFFDREPVLARMCVVQALRGGPAMLERREEILARLAAAVDEGRRESSRPADFTALTAEGLVGAAFAMVHARLLRPSSKSLCDLLGELMALIVLPYQGASAARREQTRPAPAALPRGARKFVKVARAASDPLDGVPMRLTYRTARVLEGIGEHPGASNREIADRAEVADQGQVSKLLARLQRLGLLVNDGEGHAKGEPNAWKLTTRGELVAQSIRTHSPHSREAA